MKADLKSVLLILLLIFSTSFCYGENQKPFKPSFLQPYSDGGYSFSTSSYRLKISSDGIVSVYSGNKVVKTFKLANEGYKINGIYCIPYKSDLIIFYGVDMISESRIKLTRYKISGQKVWDYTSDSFNIGPCLLENSYMYLCYFCFTGKIDLDTGKFIWQDSDDFYRKFGINTFNDVILDGNAVAFIGSIDRPKLNSGEKILKYDKNTGKKL